MIIHMTIQLLGRYLAVVLVSAALLGQPAPMRSQFEVASIKPSPPEEANRVRAGLHLDGSQVSCARFSLNDYIGMAYNVKRYQISSPDWMASEQFDITAKLPSADAAKDVPQMSQALLEDRFQLKMHRESKELPAYALVIGKGGPERREVNVAVSGQQGGATID
jgi:uncharacterized protein (TIGR03435 family)